MHVFSQMVKLFWFGTLLERRGELQIRGALFACLALDSSVEKDHLSLPCNLDNWIYSFLGLRYIIYVPKGHFLKG